MRHRHEFSTPRDELFVYAIVTLRMSLRDDDDNGVTVVVDYAYLLLSLYDYCQ